MGRDRSERARRPLGLIAVIGRFGRGIGTAGLVLGVVANPYLLTIALDRIGGLWA